MAGGGRGTGEDFQPAVSMQQELAAGDALEASIETWLQTLPTEIPEQEEHPVQGAALQEQERETCEESAARVWSCGGTDQPHRGQERMA